MSSFECPNAHEIQKMLLGQISSKRLEELSNHFDVCSDCVQLADKVSAKDSLTEAIRSASPFADDDPLVAQVIQNGMSIFHRSTSSLANSDTIRNSDDRTQSESNGKLVAETHLDFLEPAQLPDELGRLANFRILEILGRGGMGIVLRADDTKLNREVALKVLRPPQQLTPALKHRFVREAKAMAAIDHENVVPIYSVEDSADTPFIVMQLLRGASLSDRLRETEPIPPAEIARMGMELASGLFAAHSQDVVHRDLKPANVWIETSGRIKLLDFGLAQANDMPLTLSGQMLGTPKYMSPEQAQGHPVDQRSDLFSLGCVLYHMATGRPPFDGNNMTAVIHAVTIGEFNPIQSAQPDLDSELGDLIMRLLNHDPNSRPNTANEVSDQLSNIADRLSKQKVECSTDKSELEKLTPSPAVSLPNSASHRGRRILTSLFVAGAALVAVAAVVIQLSTPNGRVLVYIDSSSEPVTINVHQDKITINDPNDGQPIQISVDRQQQCVQFEKNGFEQNTSNYDLTTKIGRQIRIDFQPEAPSSPPLSRREIAEWIVERGGTVVLNNGAITATNKSDLPHPLPDIHRIFLGSAKGLRDDELSVLRNLDSDVSIFLQSSPVSGACFQYFRDIERLEHLCLRDARNLDAKNLRFLFGHKHLRWIEAHETNLGNEVALLAKQLPGLEALALGEEATSEAVVQLAECPLLNELDISSCLKISGRNGLSEIRRLSKLTFLKLNATHVGEDAVAVLNRSPRITRLTIAKGIVNPHIIKRFEHIENLDLSYNDLRGVDLTVLGEMKSLQKLGLMMCGLDTETVKKLSKSLPLCEIKADGITIPPQE